MRRSHVLALVGLGVLGLAAAPAALGQSVQFLDTNGRRINTFRAGQTVIVRFIGDGQNRFCGIWSQSNNPLSLSFKWTGWVPARRTVDVRAVASRGHNSLTGGLFYSRFNLVPLNTLWGGG